MPRQPEIRASLQLLAAARLVFEKLTPAARPLGRLLIRAGCSYTGTHTVGASRNKTHLSESGACSQRSTIKGLSN